MGWTGSAGDGNYTNKNNWDDYTDSENPATSPPTSNDFVIFSLSSGGTVNFDGGAAETLDVSGNGTWIFSGALTISGEADSPYTPYAFEIAASVTFSAVSLTAQGSGGIDGALTVQGGSTVATQDDGIGETPGATGSLTLTGTGTTWHVESDLADNQNGYITGYLTIGNGAETGTHAGGSGTLTVTAGAALLVDIGASIGTATGSTGTATVSDGGTWTVSGADGLTVGASGTGALTVNGGTVVADGGLTVGQNDGGVGSLTIVGGGTVTNDGTYTFIGGGAGSFGTMSVAGSAAVLNGTAALVIGNSGSGSAEIASDGVVDAGSLSVGQLAGGSGTLVVESGGAVDSTGFGVVGNQAGSTGTVTVADDSTITVGSGLTVGGSGTGTLTVNGGVVAVAGIISVGSNTGAVGSVTIENDGTLKETEASQSSKVALDIGYEGSGTVTVTGTGSLLDLNTNPLQVGNGAGGIGILTVAAAATAKLGSSNSTTGVEALSVGRAGGTGTIVVNAGTLTVDGYADVGLGGTGSILVENNGSLAFAADISAAAGLSIGKGSSGSISDGTGGTGAVTVTAGSTLTSAQNISVGGNGDDGTLTVNDQGKVDVGTQLVVGYAASISGVTYDGNGSVAIGAGGTLAITAAPEYANAAVSIGTTNSASLVDFGATGEITVSGTGALLNTGGSPIAIGQRGTGSLTISNNGTVVTGSPNSSSLAALGVGLQGVGSVTITGSASTLTSDGFVYLGRAGTGSLTVENYGTLAIHNGTDGAGSGSLSVGGANVTAIAATSLYIDGTGTALVTGSGRVTAATSLYVGSTGATGTLTVNNGGSVEATDQVTIGNTATLASGGTLITASGTTTVGSATPYAGTGTVDVGAGGTLKADGALSNGYAAIVVGNGAGATGTLNVSGTGALVNAGGYRITIGNYGAGTMLVSNGGTAEAGAAYTDTEAAVYIGNTAAATGALTVTGAGSTFTAAGQMDVGNAGTGSLTIDDAGAVTATALDTGVAANSSGIITATGSGSTLTVTNALDVGDDGAANLSVYNGATVTAGSVDIGVQLAGTGVLDVEDSGTQLNVSTNLTVGDGGTGTLIVGYGANIKVTGTISVGLGGSIIFDGGTLDPQILDNTGSIGGYGGYTGDIDNTGTIYAKAGLHGSTYEVDGDISGSGGLLEIENNGDLQLDGAVGGGQSAEFTTANGTLDIKDPAEFAAPISGYQTGDTVKIYGISGQPAPTYSYSGGDTIVTYNNGVTLTFVGTYSDGGIDIVADTTPAPCFLIGTHIATDRGEVAVEDLRVGDRVLTEAGGLRPIAWIGRRGIDPACHPNPGCVLPVRVRKDAFGLGAPHRDLFLSPDHAIFVQDVLIPVKYLINGRGVRQLPDFGTITYFHVELDRHDVLLAEGLPAESYLETGNRAAFANGGLPMVPHPDFGERIWEAEGCARLVVTGGTLEAARRLLLAEEAIANWRGQEYARGEMAPPHHWHRGAA
jgi:T5SS/PEP-CTERM-associated repeat protein